MLRNALLYLSDQQHIFKFVRNNRLAKSFANRFVAGETLDTALSAVARLNARGITASLDLLGESVHNEVEARAAGQQAKRRGSSARSRTLEGRGRKRDGRRWPTAAGGKR